jgi:hypothetical protein
MAIQGKRKKKKEKRKGLDGHYVFHPLIISMGD